MQPQPDRDYQLKRVCDATEPYHQRAWEESVKSNKEVRKQNTDKSFVKLRPSPRANISYYQAFFEWINM
jgi:hypothetical protein